MASLNDIQKKLEALQEQFEKANLEGLNLVNPFKGASAQEVIDNMGSIGDAASAIDREFKNVNAEIVEATSGLKTLSERFADISKELGTFQGGLKAANKSYNKLVGYADQLADAQFDLTKVDSKSLKSLKFKVNLEFKRLNREKETLQTQIESGELQGKELDKAKELLAFVEDNTKKLEEKVGYQQEFNNSLDETLRRQKNISKATGLTGKILGGFGNLLQKAGFGDISEDIQLAKDKMNALSVELTDNGDKAVGLGGQFKIMGAGLKSLGTSIASSLSDPLVIIGLLVKAAKFFYNLLGDTLKQSKDAALATSGLYGRDFIRNVEHASNKTYMLFDDTIKAVQTLRDQFGFIPGDVAKNAEAVHKLTEAYGLSGQEAANLYQVSNDMGIALDDLPEKIGESTGQFESLSGYATDFQQVMKVVSSSSAIVRNNMRGNSQELLKAANSASLMRMSLDDIRNAAETTLDFQGSIRKEMEAEMFLQKDLNLDAYRFAAATGDAAGQAKELQKLIQQNYKGLKGNTLAQQAFADATGISREQLAESIESFELQSELGFKTEASQARLNMLMKSGLSREQAIVKMKKEGAAATEKAVEEDLKHQNQMARAMEDFKEIMRDIAVGLKPVFDTIRNITTAVAKFAATPGGKLLTVLGSLVAGGTILFKFASGGWKDMIFGKGTLANPMVTRDISGGGGGGYGPDMYSPGGGRNRNRKRSRKRTRSRTRRRPRGGRMRGLLPIAGMLGLDMLMNSGGGEDGGYEMGAMDYGMMGLDAGADFFPQSSSTPKSSSIPKPSSSPKPSSTPKPKASKGWLSSAWDGVKSFGSKAMSGIKSGGSSLWGGIKSVGSSLWSGVKSVGNAAWGGIKSVGNMVLGPAIEWIKKNVGSFGLKLIKTFKKPLKGILTKIPLVGSIIEAIFTGMDVNEIAKSKDMSKEEMYSEMGKSVISGGFGLTLGSLAAGAVSSLQAVGIPGWLLSGVAYMGGDWLGRLIGNSIADYIGGPTIGKAIFDMFYSDRPSSSQEPTMMATGGIVTGATNAIVGEAGPEAVIPLNEFYNKLDELIAAVKAGGNIYMDSKKVGETIAMTTSRMG